MRARDLQDVFPLSPIQHGMLFQILANPGAGLYFEQMICTLEGPLDVGRFTAAWQRVIDRHAGFRTGFVWEGVRRPLQVVHREARLELAVTDLRALPAEARRRCVDGWLGEDRRRDFRLDRPPLVRLQLFRLEAMVHRLVWSSSHLVIDAWCVAIVLREVLLTYHAARLGERVALPPPGSYKELVRWAARQDLAEAERYWRGVLRGFRAPTPIGGREAGADTGTPGGGDHRRQRIELAAETSEALRGLGRRHGLTLHALALGTWGLALAEGSGHDDVVFGAVFSGRPPDLPGVEATVGVFINTLPLRLRLEPARPFLDWVRSLQEQQLTVHAHEGCPLGQVLRWSEVPPGRPLFESILVFFNVVDESLLAAGDLRIRDVRDVARSNFPLVVRVWPRVEGSPRLGLEMIYDPRRFGDDEIAERLERLRSLVELLVARPDAALEELLARWRNGWATDPGGHRPSGHRARMERRLAALRAPGGATARAGEGARGQPGEPTGALAPQSGRGGR